MRGLGTRIEELGIPFLITRSSFLAFSARLGTAVCHLALKIRAEDISGARNETR
jgi:hypothetical protein